MPNEKFFQFFPINVIKFSGWFVRIFSSCNEIFYGNIKVVLAIAAKVNQIFF
jgi:hypothetical protein